MQAQFPEESSVMQEIIEEVNKMDIGQKQKLLVQLRRKTILDKTKNLDSVNGVVRSVPMTDKQADNYVSEQRRMKYEQSQA